VDLRARSGSSERVDDVLGRADLGVAAAEVDDVGAGGRDAAQQGGEVLLRQALEPVGAWAHRAIVDSSA